MRVPEKTTQINLKNLTPEALVTILKDSTNLENVQWITSLMEGQNQVLEGIAQGKSLETVLSQLALVIEAHSDQELYCSFLLFDAQESRLLHGAAPSLPKEYCDVIHGMLIGPGEGSCGSAAYSKKSVVVEDVTTDPLWKNFCDLALKFGLRSCWSTPILDRHGEVLATFAMYHPCPYKPTARDRELVDKATYLARIAIERQITETELTLANESLEQKVEQRTRDLETVVNSLQEQIREREAAESKLQTQAAVLKKTLRELRQTQVHMLQSEKMSSLGHLVAGVAHEINNPVSFIHGNLVHVQDQTASLFQMIELYQRICDRHQIALDTKEKQALEALELNFIQVDLPKILQSMQVGTERIQNIVLSLRNFSRKDEAGRKTVDIHEGLKSTLGILGHRLKGNQTQSEITVDQKFGKLPEVSCYPGLLNQVFMNVLSNALDAIQDREKVLKCVTARESDALFNQEEGQNGDGQNIYRIGISTQQVKSQDGSDQVEIAIADRGQGIRPELQSRIFDPFFTTKPVGKGTGLGMSISYQIITQQHNGSIICNSQWGQGTTFYIRIPVQ